MNAVLEQGWSIPTWEELSSPKKMEPKMTVVESPTNQEKANTYLIIYVYKDGDRVADIVDLIGGFGELHIYVDQEAKLMEDYNVDKILLFIQTLDAQGQPNFLYVDTVQR